MGIKIIHPGIYTTIQDEGRFGYESLGFSPAGAMDYESYYLANQLIGNDLNTPVLEMTLKGAKFQVTSNVTIGTAGADMPLLINDEEYKVGAAIDLIKGDVVEFGVARKGVRTYVAFLGGFDIKPELGSYSTHSRSKIGGFGRPLQPFDVVDLNGGLARHGYKVVTKDIDTSNVIRVVKGQQYDYFDEKNLDNFFHSEYTVSKDSDRMGYRLDGESVEAESHDIISETILFGSIQIPKNGKPIILLSDRQTAGGYTKIATVAKVDIQKIAQKKPGDKIQFKLIEVEEAVELYKEHLRAIKNKEFIGTTKEFSNVRRPVSERIHTLIGGNS